MPLDQMAGLLFILGGATLLIGGVGILTMMLDSVQERRQEIGVRLAVGARRRDILGQFLLETFVITGLGGLARPRARASAARSVLAQPRRPRPHPGADPARHGSSGSRSA